MNFSTNQVKQFYVVADSTAATAVANSAKVFNTQYGGDAGKAVVLTINGERTDIIPLDKVLYTNVAYAANAAEQLVRKGVLIALNSNVNSGNPVAGQDYIIKVDYRGHIGEEVVYSKFAEAHATTGMTAAQLLQKLALSFLANVNVEPSPLYELYATDGTKLDASNVASKVSTGFYFVEPVPYWRLGSFPESLMNMAISTKPITVNSDEVTEWLNTYAFAPISASDIAAVTPIYNSHKVADLEYFCKGEKGVSAPLHMPYDIQFPANLQVNPNATYGYDLLTVHYAFVGANASNQKSEKDLVIAMPGSGSASNDSLAAIAAAITGGTVDATLADHEDRIEALEDAD